jgi:hypothetical protein
MAFEPTESPPAIPYTCFVDARIHLIIATVVKKRDSKSPTCMLWYAESAWPMASDSVIAIQVKFRSRRRDLV